MRAESRAYGNRFSHAPEALRSHFDLARSVAVLEDGQIVGGGYSHLIEVSVPGGVATVAGQGGDAAHSHPALHHDADNAPLLTASTSGANPWPCCSPPRASSTGGSATASGWYMSSAASIERTTLTPTVHSATSHQNSCSWHWYYSDVTVNGILLPYGPLKPWLSLHRKGLTCINASHEIGYCAVLMRQTGLGGPVVRRGCLTRCRLAIR